MLSTETCQARQEASAAELALEEHLVEKAQTDAKAFAALYDRYVERLYHYCYRHLGSHTEAEDCTAQVFRRALEGLPRYEWRGLPFGAWLFRIAHNQLADCRREVEALSLDVVSEAGYAPVDEGQTPEATAIQAEAIDTAWMAVATLPALQRRAVTLRFGRDLTHAEVGALIGRSEAATKQLVYRAMLSLRARLNEEGEKRGADVKRRVDPSIIQTEI